MNQSHRDSHCPVPGTAVSHTNGAIAAPPLGWRLWEGKQLSWKAIIIIIIIITEVGC